MGLSFGSTRAFFSSVRTPLVGGEDAMAPASFIRFSGLSRPDEGFANAFEGDRTTSNLVIRVGEHL